MRGERYDIMGLGTDQGIWVTLSTTEVMQASMVGIQWFMNGFEKGMQHKPPLPPEANALVNNIEGACGEMAYAKARGLYFEPRLTAYKGADFGDNVQVRTRSDHAYELMVRDNDNPEHFYVLVTGKAPVYCVVGWIQGRDAMKPEWRKDWGGRGEAWFVPHKALTPFKEKAA